MTEEKKKRPRTLAEQKAALEQRQAEIAQRLRDIKAKEAKANRRERTGQLIGLGLAVAAAIEKGDLQPATLQAWAAKLEQRERDRVTRYLAQIKPVDSQTDGA